MTATPSKRRPAGRGAHAYADVAVLGAGPAGLMAAYRLASSGRRVVLLERSDRVGGLAASFVVGGQRVDHGSHRLHPTTAPPVMRVIRDLLGEDLQRRARRGRMRLADRWVGFPPRPLDLARRLPPRLAARLAVDAARGPMRRPPEVDTFDAVVRARLGPALLEAFYAPYVRKIWGVGPEALSGELARRRVGASPGALARRLVPGRGGDKGVFLYPRTGFGTIVERLADAAVAAGADLRLGASVDAIVSAGSHTTVTAGHLDVEAPLVLSTIPVTALVERLRPQPPRPVLEAAARLRFRAVVLVYLVLRGDRFTGFDAHYVPGPEARFARLSEPKNYRDGPDREDRTVLCAEIPCSVGDEVWEASDDELARVVVDGVAALRLPAARPVEVASRRIPNVYPVYGLGYERDFAAVDDAMTAIPRLLTFGRQGLFAHDNSHHAMSMAIAAADAVTDDGLDAARWSAARATFASHVVED